MQGDPTNWGPQPSGSLPRLPSLILAGRAPFSLGAGGVWSPVPGQEGWAAGATHISFITAGLEDEFLRLVLPTLHRSVGGGQAGGPKGQLGLAVLFL